MKGRRRSRILRRGGGGATSSEEEEEEEENPQMFQGQDCSYNCPQMLESALSLFFLGGGGERSILCKS